MYTYICGGRSSRLTDVIDVAATFVINDARLVMEVYGTCHGFVTAHALVKGLMCGAIATRLA